LANGTAPCRDGAFRRNGDEGLWLSFSDVFERGKIGLGPSGIMAADGVDDFRRQSSEDGGVQGSCEVRGKRRVRRLGDAAGKVMRVLLGLRECWPCILSGGCFGRARVADAKNHSGLDARTTWDCYLVVGRWSKAEASSFLRSQPDPAKRLWSLQERENLLDI
jgi:hypothetical protein